MPSRCRCLKWIVKFFTSALTEALPSVLDSLKGIIRALACSIVRPRPMEADLPFDFGDFSSIRGGADKSPARAPETAREGTRAPQFQWFGPDEFHQVSPPVPRADSTKQSFRIMAV